MIKGIRETYPDARIGVVCPYYFNGEPSRRDRAEWMKRRCNQLHVQCIDGCAVSGLDWDNPSQKDFFRDEVHLSIKGHKRMSYIYEHFLRGL